MKQRMKQRLSHKLRLLPKSALIKTGPVDHADWNYKPILGWIIRKRYEMALPLLRQQPIRRLLKVGYGSGVFLPELFQHCQELYGIDIHPRAEEVNEILADFGIEAHLQTASAVSLPYTAQFFDCVVIISALEFIDDLDAVCNEVKRVLTPGGFLLVVTPGQSKLLDLGLKLLTGESAEADFGDRRKRIIPTLHKHFKVTYRQSFPGWPFSWLGFYTLLSLRPLIPQELSEKSYSGGKSHTRSSAEEVPIYSGTSK